MGCSVEVSTPISALLVNHLLPVSVVNMIAQKQNLAKVQSCQRLELLKAVGNLCKSVVKQIESLQF